MCFYWHIFTYVDPYFCRPTIFVSLYAYVWAHVCTCLYTCAQGFVNASFENISSTEQALLLIRQFETILLRENLRADLESK